MKYYIFIIFTVLVSSYLQAQAPHLRHFTVDEGLPSSLVYRVLQDSKGFLWVCTDRGIARFDGYHFEVFTTEKDLLPYNDYWGIKEDSKGRIWFSTYASHFVYYDYSDNLFHVKENNLVKTNRSQTGCISIEDAKGDIWYSSYGNLYNTEKDTFLNEYASQTNILNGILDDRFIHEYVYDIRAIHNNVYYYGIATKRNPQDKEFIYRDSVAIPQKYISPLYAKLNLREHNYLYWNGGNNQFYYRSPSSQKQASLSSLTRKRASTSQYIHLKSINEAEILVNTGIESFVIDTNLHRVTKYDFIQDMNINTICTDKENNRWICTKNEGIYLLTADAMESHTFCPTSQSQDIRALTADNTGRIWVGTSQGDVYYMEKDSLKKLYFQRPSNLSILDISVSPFQTLIIAYDGYIVFYPLSLLAHNSRMIEMNWAQYSTSFDCSIELCKSKTVYKDRNKVMVTNDVRFRNFYTKKGGDILFSIPSSARYTRFSDYKNWQEYNSFYVKHRVYAAVSSQNDPDNTWVGTSIGLFYFREKTLVLDTLSALKQRYPLLSKPILDMATDTSGNVWVATDGWGLYGIKAKQETEWNPIDGDILEIEGLKNKIIKSLFVDKNNHLWIASNSGAYELWLTTEGKTALRLYSIAQGLPTNEVNAIYANEDFVFVATTKGLTKIPLRHVKTHTLPLLNVYSTVHGYKWNPLEYKELSYKENNIRFNFVALSFRSDKKIIYHYRMRKNNANPEWEETAEIYKEFLLLPPANYEFEVQATDIDGTKTEIQGFKFVINPPWWQTQLFRYSLWAMILASILVAAAWRIRYIQRREKKQTTINKKIAELELKALQAQLDEHFVFNCLNAIQSFIVKKDTLTASLYLSKFAHLIRLFLQSSRKKFIPISDELSIIQLFIDLELMRFRERVKAEIKIEGEIDVNAEIPSLLIQPYVENAFEHGFKSKKMDGLLSIIVRQEHNILYISIDDNGIGREAAQTMKVQTLNKWDSLGTKIIADRVTTLREMENIHIQINIIDKVSNEGGALGTRVEIEVEV